MPGAIAGALGAIGIGATAAGVIGNVVTIIGLNVVTSKLFGPKIPSGAGLQAKSVVSRSAIEYRQIVYGQAATSGPIWYNNTSGADNEFLWYAIALAEDQSEELVSIWFDGTEIAAADIDWTPGTGGADGTGTGDVSLPKYVGENSTNAVSLFYYLGDPDQPVCGPLNTAFGDIDSTHRGRGVTHLVARLLYNEDTEEVWSQGPPQNYRAVIKGRLIYDPRLDSTNGGAGSHRYTDPATWEWSDNPALCIADYLTQIMGVDPASRIDWPAFSQAADDCDALVPIPGGTEKRFTCNGTMSLGASHRDNLESLTSSCDGKLTYASGVWKLRVSVWEAPSLTITEDDLRGDVQVRGSAPKGERNNLVRGFYVDPARKYESVEFPHVESLAYQLRDGGDVIPFDLVLPMTNANYMAQRIAIRNLEQGNNQRLVTTTLGLMGAQVTVGDVVTFTAAGIDQPMRCLEWSPRTDGNYDVVLREDNASSYADPAAGDYADDSTGNLTPGTSIVPAPSGLTAVALPTGVELNWISPAARTHDYVDVYASPDNAWANAVRVARVRADTFTHNLPASTTRFYWVQAIRLPATVSARFPDSDVSTITATSGSLSSAVVTQLTVSSETISALSDGTGYNLAGAGTRHLVFDGAADVTPSATHTFDNGLTEISISGLRATIDGNGVVSLNDNPAWTSNKAQFTCRANYGSVNYDKVYTITKARAGVDGTDGADGADGTDGDAIAEVFIYRRDTSVPATPTGGTFSFVTNTLTVVPTGWSADIPAGTDPVYTSISTASGPAGSEDSSLAWTVPVRTFQDGDAGEDGLSVHVATVFRRSVSAPAIPTGGSYDFGTRTLIPPAGWSEAQPAENGQDLYSSTATFSVQGTTGVDSSTTWSAPILVQRAVETLSVDASLPNRVDAIDLNLDTSPAEAAFRVTSLGGGIQSRGNGPGGGWPTTDGLYREPGASSSDYDVSFSLTGDISNNDTPSGDPSNTWLNCGTTRTWTLTQTSAGSQQATGQLRFRNTSNGALLGTVDVFIYVERL